MRWRGACGGKVAPADAGRSALGDCKRTSVRGCGATWLPDDCVSAVTGAVVGAAESCMLLWDAAAMPKALQPDSCVSILIIYSVLSRRMFPTRTITLPVKMQTAYLRTGSASMMPFAVRRCCGHAQGRRHQLLNDPRPAPETRLACDHSNIKV